jgi:Domain of unknown function (DUF397)
VSLCNPANLAWRKSSRSGGGEDSSCVETASAPALILVRDSKSPSVGALMFSPDQWHCLIRGVKNEELDRL